MSSWNVRRMRWRVMGALIGLALGVGACGLKVSNTEYLLSQAGFRKVPGDTPQKAEHIQTVAAHKLIRRKSGDGKPYYVYADPNYCQCMYVGSESQYATYKTLVQQQDEAMALQEEREHEDFQGDK